MKTIKQIADEFGVSKDRVKYRVRKLPLSYLSKEGEITYVNNEGVEELRGVFGREADGVKTGESLGNTHDVSTQLIGVLKSELDAKNRQLEAQAAQISDLTAALAAAHTLAAATSKQPLIEEKPERHEKGIFARFFGKRKG